MGTRDEEFTTYVVQRRAQHYRTALLLCGGDAHLAEDVVQQALTKVYTAWPRVRRADSVDAYVRRVLANAHLDEVRRPWHRERPFDVVADRADRAGLAERADASEDAVVLFDALRSLAPGQRRVVVLRHYLGLSVEETASDLGISPGTVKSQTSDALAQLRTLLTREVTR